MACGALYSSCPLTSLEDHIRILRLAPAPTREAELHGELEVRSFDRLPDYEALSYTWQPPFDDQVLPEDAIWFFGFPLRITGNLNDALRRLRRIDKERVMWIDAICIDQDNPSERNHQALLMAKIYSNATEVVAWLGEDSDMCDGMYTFGLSASDRPAFPAYEGLLPWGSTESGAISLDRIRKLDRQGYTQANIFRQMACRRYWRRRWVVQELVLARSIVLLCGPHSIPWHMFLSGLEECRGTMPGKELGPIHDFVALVWSLRSEESTSGSILGVLQQFNDLECSDDRDRVCALMHLQKFPELSGFEPDYSMSCEILYTSFAACVLRAAPDLFPRLFCLAALQSWRWTTDEQHLPSWVPDWRQLSAASKEIAWSERVPIADSPWQACSFVAEHDGSLRARMPLCKVENSRPIANNAFKSRRIVLADQDLIVGPAFEIYLGQPYQVAFVLRKTGPETARTRIIGLYILDSYNIQNLQKKLDWLPEETIDVVIT